MPSARAEALFQELILDHYRRPRNRRAMEDADRVASLRNPLCGDDVSVYLALEGDAVRAATFVGQGCSITQAAASMLTSAAAGRTLGELGAMLARYRGMIAGDLAAVADDEAFGELRALSGVARYPARHRCALLPADALARAAGGARDAADATDRRATDAAPDAPPAG